MIFTIFKKELKDTLRDKRTLLMMVVIPVLIFPLIINIFVNVSESFSEEAANKTIKVGCISENDNYIFDRLDNLPESYGKKEIAAYKDTVQLKKDIRNDSVQIGIYTSAEFTKNMSEKKPASVIVFFSAADMGMKERAKAYMTTIENIAQQERYLDLKLIASELNPIETKYTNVKRPLLINDSNNVPMTKWK